MLPNSAASAGSRSTATAPSHRFEQHHRFAVPPGRLPSQDLLMRIYHDRVQVAAGGALHKA